MVSSDIAYKPFAFLDIVAGDDDDDDDGDDDDDDDVISLFHCWYCHVVIAVTDSVGVVATAVTTTNYCRQKQHGYNNTIKSL